MPRPRAPFRSLSLASASVLAGVVAAHGASAQDPPDPAARVDSIFASYDNTRSPGCALGVIRDGDFVLRRGYGMANLEHGVPITSSTVFRTGSVGKQFTAATVLLLARDGVISLDDDVRRHIPELQEHAAPVTIDQLVHHTSGIRDYLVLMALAGKRGDDFYTDDEVVAMLARQRELNFEPGSEFLYSNSGYFLLSQVVKRATGKTLRQVAEERIFGPLSMADSHFHDDHTEIVPNRASGYAPVRGGGYRISMTTLDMVGDGGVFTTLDDLLHWVRNFYDDGLDGGGVVPASLRRAPLASGDSTDYAFGLTHGTYRGLRTVGHGGAFVGFRADITHFPDQRFDVVTLCNLASANPTALARRVADVWLGDLMEPPTAASGAAGGAGPGGDPTEYRTLPPARLASFAGAYHSDELDAAYTLTVRDDGLEVRVGARPPIHVRPTTDVDFAGAGRVFHFERAGGRVTGFTLDAGRVRNLRFVRR